MKKGFFSAITACLVLATLTVAQAPPAAPDANAAAVSPFPPSAPSAGPPGEDVGLWDPCPAGPRGNRFWIGTEYLLWRVKDAPLPVPLVTASTRPDILAPGALGQPGTSVLFGGTPVNLGTFSGTRATVGGWLNSARTFGIEGSAFLLEQRSAFFNARSDANGNPVLAFPIFDPVAGAESAIPVTYPPVPPPGFSQGGISVASSTRLWGSEVNGLFNVARSDAVAVDLLAGFRYLDLQESLTVSGNALITDSDGTSTANQVGVDYFGTRNQFYGGQVGARVSWYWRNWTVIAGGKVALGQTHQVLTVNGNTQVLNPTGDLVGIAPPFSPGSVYSQPTNMGRFAVNQFSVVPELQFKLGYALSSNWRAFVGYDFLYWSNVLRPGDQVDRAVNTSQRFGAPLMGPALPAPLLRPSDFWAQGATLGLQFRF